MVPLWWAAKRVLGELPQVDGGRRRSQLAVVAVEESASGVAHDRSPPASTVSDAEGRPRVEQLCSEISKAFLLQRDLVAIVRRGHVHAALAEESEYTHIRRLARDAHGGVNEIVGIKRSLQHKGGNGRDGELAVSPVPDLPPASVAPVTPPPYSLLRLLSSSKGRRTSPPGGSQGLHPPRRHRGRSKGRWAE